MAGVWLCILCVLCDLGGQRFRPVTGGRARFPIPVRAVAFDLDGTLLDTLPDIADAADRMLADLGRAPVGQKVVRSYIGNGIARLTKRLLTGEMQGEPPEDVFARAHELFESHYRITLTLRTRPYPGVEDGLRWFARSGLRLACVTNKAESFTLPLLEATGLRHFFELVLSGDSLPRKKPDPLPLLHCASRLGARPEELLMIGDSANDAEAARAAGCPVLCVPYGYRHGEVRDLDCDAIVDGLIEATRLIIPVRS
jgi:phosphoglycolate phosphatase